MKEIYILGIFIIFSIIYIISSLIWKWNNKPGLEIIKERGYVKYPMMKTLIVISRFFCVLSLGILLSKYLL